MRWTCPKCGKKLVISNERLIANDGVIVCPQCLLQARQPVPKTRSTASKDKTKAQSPPPKRKQQNISFDTDTPPEYKPSSTPPPHKTRMKQASTSYRSGNGDNGSQRSTSNKRKTTGKKKSKKKKEDKSINGWGCLGRTIIFTLVLFAAYVFFGLLLEALQ